MYPNFLLYNCWITLSHQVVDTLWGCLLDGQSDVLFNCHSMSKLRTGLPPNVTIFLCLSVEDSSLGLSRLGIWVGPMGWRTVRTRICSVAWSGQRWSPAFILYGPDHLLNCPTPMLRQNSIFKWHLNQKLDIKMYKSEAAFDESRVSMD